MANPNVTKCCEPVAPHRALDPLCVVPLSTHAQTFLANSGAINMSLKSACYLIRLFVVYNPQTKAATDPLLASLTDCRILTGVWRHVETFAETWKAAFGPQCHHPLWTRMLTLVALVFRAVGQLTGDLRYMHDHWFSNWSASRVLWHYQFSKSVSQSCSAVLELFKLREYWAHRDALIKQSASANHNLDTATGYGLQKQEAENDGRIESMVLALVRDIADAIVYFQWIPWYHKRLPRTVEACCGLLSGLVGVLQCWRLARRTAAAATSGPSARESNVSFSR